MDSVEGGSKRLLVLCANLSKKIRRMMVEIFSVAVSDSSFVS